MCAFSAELRMLIGPLTISGKKKVAIYYDTWWMLIGYEVIMLHSDYGYGYVDSQI